MKSQFQLAHSAYKIVLLVVILISLVSAYAPASVFAADTSDYIPHLSVNGVVTFTQLGLYANIETVGVAVSGVNLPKTAQLMYRQSSDTDWHLGHPLMRIDDGRLIGSLFGLSPVTTYNIKVIDGSTEISGSVTTQPNELQFVPSTIVHVDDDAQPGGDGSEAAPFHTIQEGINRAKPGTQVLVADGIYHEAVTFPASGSAGNWIQVKAEGGGAILDGSQDLAGSIWTPLEGKKNVWFTKIGASIKYLARDEKRFYMYDNRSGLIQGIGHAKVPMNEGWYFEPSTLRLYVRSLDNPSNHTWQVPRLNHAFDASGRDWLWIEGFEMRFYGTRTDGCGVCTINASHVVIRNNRIHNLQLGIYVNWTGGETRGNDTRIEYNEIYDPPVNEWPWDAVKGSSMEGTAIVVRGHIGAIVRGNNIHNYFNGIFTGSSGALENSALAFDADIYNNFIHDISDDALEPEGACINHRFRNNTIDSSFVGVSLAPITKGPVWVLHTSITNYTSRSIKWALNSDGIVLIYHNTSWTNANNANAMDLITPVSNSVMRNNIFQGNGYAFEAIHTGAKGNDWNNDNWYTTRPASSHHFKWENITYDTVAKLCAGTGLECNGYEDLPGLTNPGGGDFTLLSSSPNIDRGVVIPGINDDFIGNAPDIGAYEFGLDPSPTVSSIVRADPNRTDAASVKFTVTFSESVSGVDGSDFTPITTGALSGASVTNVSGSGNVYTVTADTGANNGTLSIHIQDDDSIIDSANKPLGGTGIGNGNFTLGEIYTVIKAIVTRTVTFRSNSANDGWVLESNENTNQGGSLDSVSATFYVGDNAQDRQFRAILDFSTSALPDNAILTGATLKIKKLSVTGTDPFTTHQNLLVDISNGTFGTSALQVADFQTAASMESAGTILNAPADNWYSTTLDEAVLQYINKTGVTQFRLRFQLDDNDDLGADTIKFYSGNTATLENRPVLQIEYYVP